MKRYFTFILAGILMAPGARSQKVSPMVADHFADGIVGQVYEAVCYAQLDDPQQLAFARLLQKRDSTLAGMIRGGSSSATVEWQRRVFEKQLHGLAGLKRYYDSVAVLAGGVDADHELPMYARYRLSPEGMSEVKRLVKEKHVGLARIEGDYSLNARQRDSLEKAVFVRGDSLIQSALMRDGVLISSSHYVAALRYRTLLQLTKGQIDSLVAAGMHATWMRDSALQSNPFATLADARENESYNLSIILSEKQLSTILSVEYRSAAEFDAERDWQDLEKRGLTVGMDKQKVIQSLTEYHLRVRSASYMYAYDLNKQSAYSHSVRDAMPKELKMLLYARRNNITSANVESLNNQ